MTAHDNTIQTEGLSSFCKNLGRDSAKAGNKLASKVLRNPGRTLEFFQTLLLQLQPETIKMYCQHY